MQSRTSGNCADVFVTENKRKRALKPEKAKENDQRNIENCRQVWIERLGKHHKSRPKPNV